MTSTRPYLIRAFYEWIADNQFTPYIVVNADFADVQVPTEYIEGGQIVLNVAMRAVNNLDLGNDAIAFDARFGGVSRSVYVPTGAVMAIYARENGRGMAFADDEDFPPGDDDTTSSEESKETGGKGKGTSKKGGPPHLTVVK